MLLMHAPVDYTHTLGALPATLVWAKRADPTVDLVQHFSQQRSELSTALADYRARLRSDAVLWISWPKKASKVPTDITEDTVRELALPLGWVDVKVCAVDAVWSGLKLSVRKTLR